MPELEDDIAHLRGRSADAYLGAERVRQVTRIARERLSRLFEMDHRPLPDLRAHDALPARSKRFIEESALPLNAGAWADFLIELEGDEAALIEQVSLEMPGRLRAWARLYYGERHPTVRRVM